MTTIANKPKGYFQYVLAADCETSGLALNCDDASYNPDTGEVYQSVAWGLIIADADTLKPIKKLYLEIQWDGKSVWSKQAENVHGLSKEHLAENGLTNSEAVEAIANFILPYWGPTNSIRLVGHNVATFDMWFLKRLMRSEQIELRFGNRHIDTSSLGFGTFGTYTSDELFETVGLPKRDPSKHNALTDAEYSLESVRRIRAIFQRALEG